MNPPKCTRNDFINFLIATYRACSCTEASRCIPSEEGFIAYDSVKRLLERQPAHTEALYEEANPLIRPEEGVLVIDDSTLDNPYAHQMDLVTRHWSGKSGVTRKYHCSNSIKLSTHLVVQGINLITNLWTDGTAIVPVDYRIYST